MSIVNFATIRCATAIVRNSARPPLAIGICVWKKGDSQAFVAPEVMSHMGLSLNRSGWNQLDQLALKPLWYLTNARLRSEVSLYSGYVPRQRKRESDHGLCSAIVRVFLGASL